MSFWIFIIYFCESPFFKTQQYLTSLTVNIHCMMFWSFWNQSLLEWKIIDNIFFYLYSHRVCNIHLWDYFYSIFWWVFSENYQWLKYGKGSQVFWHSNSKWNLKSLRNSSKKHGKDISGVYYRCRWSGLRPFCSQLLATMGWKQFWKYFFLFIR